MPQQNDRVVGAARRVLLATDGSAQAHAALSLLTALAWPPGTTFWVTRVVEGGSPPVPAASHLATKVEANWRQVLELAYDEARERARADVGEAAAALRARFTRAQVEEVVRIGEPATELLSQIGEVAAEFVVAGARGHTVVHGLLLGSVSEALVTEAPCPVLIVRQATTPLERVVVAVRTAEDADRLAAACLLVPLPPATELVALTVLDPLPLVRPSVDPYVTARLDEMLRELAIVERAGAETTARRFSQRVRAAEPGRAIATRVVRGAAAPEILAGARTPGAGLIVTGARERRGVTGRLGLGSVSRKLVRRADAAVLIVREPGTAPRA